MRPKLRAPNMKNARELCLVEKLTLSVHSKERLAVTGATYFQRSLRIYRHSITEAENTGQVKSYRRIRLQKVTLIRKRLLNIQRRQFSPFNNQKVLL